MIERDGDHDFCYFTEYDGIYEMLTEIEKRGLSTANEHHSSTGTLIKGKNRPDAGADWYGNVPSIYEYQELVESGWGDGEKKIVKAMKRMELPRARNIKRTPCWSDDGDDLDIQKLYAGETDRMWFTAKRLFGQNFKNVRIVVNLSAHCGIEADELFWRGASATILADVLEEAGYRTEIACYEMVSEIYGNGKANKKLDGAQFCSVTTVKHLDAPVNIGALTALLSHPAALRTAIFADQLTRKRRAAAHLGIPVHVRPYHLLGPNDIWIDGVWDETAANQKVLDCVNKIEGQYEN